MFRNISSAFAIIAASIAKKMNVKDAYISEVRVEPIYPNPAPRDNKSMSTPCFAA